MDIKNYVKRNVLAFKTQVLDPVYATKDELANIPSGGGGSVDPSVITDAVNDYLDKHPVSGADVPTTDIDFSNWEERGIN